MKKILSLLLAMAMLVGCNQPAEVPAEEVVTETPAEVIEEKLSIYEEDALYLIEQVEDLHPCFVMDDTPENYEEVKAAYLEVAKSCEDDETFSVASHRYITCLQDGHSSVGINGLVRRMLNLNSIRYEGTQWLLDENGAPTNTKVLSIGGVDMETIWATVGELFAIENESGYIYFRHQSMCDGVLQEAGVDVSNDELEVLLEQDGQQYIEKYPLIPMEKYVAAHPEAGFVKKVTATYEMIGDVFYLDFNQCVLDESLDQTTEALKEAIRNGTSKVIVDVRGNTGGNSKAGKQIMDAMGMKTPPYSSYIRTKGTSNVNRYEYELKTEGLANPDIDLIVLSDEMTYSSGRMFCIWTQDGDLGRVIGRPSSNKPNSYGDVIQGNLPNTGFSYQISHKKWVRPDKNANPDIMEMDVYVPYGSDALEVALELLAE